MSEPIHPDNRTQPVALVVQLRAETGSRGDVTDVSRGNPNDRLVSAAIGDDRSGVRLLGQLRDVHRLVVEADRQLTRLTNIGGERVTARRRLEVRRARPGAWVVPSVPWS
jgi:hypothetical protein